MIPAAGGDLKQDFVISELPSRTFKLNTAAETIAGHVDGLEAVKQAIYLILNVERYEYLIHSWNHGAELSGLIGKPVSFCLPEIKRRITEALLQDSRITEVRDFDFEIHKGKVHAAFAADTIFGTISTEREVEI